jgi:putative zinc finger/helix-turn-helix YgiT family protein
MRRCHSCGSESLRQSTEVVRARLRSSGIRASATVPVRQCATCGETYLEGSVLQAFEVAVARELANKGVRTGEAFRFMRTVLGLRAADLAKLLGVTPETISHWETGKVAVNRATFVAVGALVEDAAEGRSTTHSRFARLAADRPYPKVLRPKLQLVE